MDNAARALVMAASIILGVLLFSVFAYVFRAGASLDESYDAAQNKRQLDLFNSKFEVYDKTDNTIMNMISLANSVYNVNRDFNYDPTMAIELILKLESKCIVIPRNEPTTNFSRNQVFWGDENGNISGDPISIYDLADKTLEELDLNISEGNNQDKLSKTQLGSYTYTTDMGTQLDKNNVTIYKYIFSCENIAYNPTTGRINGIKFQVTKNPNYVGE